jgi:tetraacyldisaccharide-1-P 4'-kinase
LTGWLESGKLRLITTEKDQVRWPEQGREQLLVWPVELQMQSQDDLAKLLRGVIAKCG